MVAPEAAQHRRLAPALRARLPHALAAGDGVLLPAQAGARERTRFNAFYAGDFDHDETREVEFVMGACLLVRRDAIDAVGPPDSAFFLFSEETDWCYRFHQAGWSVVFYPGAEVVHVSGAAHGGRFFKENVRGHLRFFAKHHGAREADRARRLMLWALRLRGVAVPRRARPHVPRHGVVARLRLRAAARRRASLTGRASPARWPWELLALPALALAHVFPETGVGLYVRLAAATLCLLVPGALVARALGQQSVFAALSWSLAGLTAASAMMFAVEGPLWWALVLYAGSRRGRSPVRGHGTAAPAVAVRPRGRPGAGIASASRCGRSPGSSTATRSSISPASASSRRSTTSGSTP